MTTTLAPSLGHGALMVQQGVGTTPGYDAIDVRRMSNGDLQEGVLNASDFMVVQRAAGANLSVDIGMPAGGYAYVQGDTVSGQGLYTVPVHSATVNEAITAANATNPRIDQIILEVLDNVHDASGSNLARTRVLTGTATAGATLANRTGAAILPGSALLLADVLVGATATTIDNTKIRDRRKWARGGLVRQVRATTNITTASTTQGAIDTATLQARVECSGAPVRFTLTGLAQNSTAGALIGFNFWQDGTGPDSIGTGSIYLLVANSSATSYGFTVSYVTVPAAGSHVFAPAWGVSAGTATLLSGAGSPVTFTVEEVVRQNSANNTSTSG